MNRRVWVIPQGTEITPQVLEDAMANNCPEIAKGTPPALRQALRGKKLPLAYEEPERPVAVPVRDLATELDELKAIVDGLLGQ